MVVFEKANLEGRLPRRLPGTGNKVYQEWLSHMASVNQKLRFYLQWLFRG